MVVTGGADSTVRVWDPASGRMILTPLIGRGPFYEDDPIVERGATHRHALGCPAGKRDALLEHSVLKLNADLAATNPEPWTEAAIRQRSVQLAQALLATWPRPRSSAAPFSLTDAEKDPEPTAVEEADSPVGPGIGNVGKYQALAEAPAVS